MLDGVFYGTRAALRHMEAQGFGAIVNTASIGAFHPAPDYPFYAAAKAGVVAFTRSVGHEVAGAGIRVERGRAWLDGNRDHGRHRHRFVLVAQRVWAHRPARRDRGGDRVLGE